jgi:Ca2+/H+ antiporter, TMEM165/GDT1 family
MKRPVAAQSQLPRRLRGSEADCGRLRCFTAVVAVAENGDKTQLLVLALAAHFRKPIPIIFGMLVATLLNHAVAGALGVWLAVMISPSSLLSILSLSFLSIAICALIVPDNAAPTAHTTAKIGVFATTL